MAKELTEGQRAYEAKRAAKAGMNLDKWLASKEREKAQAAAADAKAVKAAKDAATPKKPGLISRLIARAEKPL
jgi:hypothetical protein